MSQLLSVKNLHVAFDGRGILEDIDFTVDSGEVLAIIGPNGAGKTVLFKTLLGLEKPTTGTIEWRPGVKIGYVPQRFEIEIDLPLTTREFLYLRGGDVSESKIGEVMNLVGMKAEILNRRFSDLSVGQRQRILVAWAMMNDPEILLFDEPTADIDVSGQQSIYHLLRQLQDKKGFAVILISHDLSIVYRYSDQVLCLNRRKLCFGTPREVLSAEQLTELYGGEHGFYQHLEKSFHHHD